MKILNNFCKYIKINFLLELDFFPKIEACDLAKVSLLKAFSVIYEFFPALEFI